MKMYGLNRFRKVISVSLLSFGITVYASHLRADAVKEGKPTDSGAASGMPSPSMAQSADQVLITVDGKEITTQDYVGFLQSNPTVISRATSSDQGKVTALRELVGGYLLRRAMYDEKLLDKAGKEPSQNDIAKAYENLAERHFPLPPVPDDKAGLDYYKTHQDEYGIPDMFRLNEIYIKHPQNPDAPVLAAAKVRAEKALKRLEAGEAFADVAADITENKLGKVTRGDVGYVNVAEKPWLESALKGMGKGQRSGLIDTPAGFLILEITDIRPGLISPYANVRDKVLQTLREEEQRKLRDAYLRQLAKTVKIEVKQDGLKPLFPKGVFEAE
ncbi:hypothetical protein JCM19379_28510 [Methyloparacoccus murrellii]